MEEKDPPGGSSMKGITLSGKPGMVQAMELAIELAKPLQGEKEKEKK